MTAAELARRAGVSSAAVSQLVGGLEHAGWIGRSRENDDRRRHALALSAAGDEVLRSSAHHVRQGLGHVLVGLPVHETKELARLLEHLEAVLGGSPPPRRPPPPRPSRP